MQGRARLVDGQRHDIELNIGPPVCGVAGAGAAADLPGPDGQWTGALGQPVQAHFGQFQRVAYVVIQRDFPVQL